MTTQLVLILLCIRRCSQTKCLYIRVYTEWFECSLESKTQIQNLKKEGSLEIWFSKLKVYWRVEYKGSWVLAKECLGVHLGPSFPSWEVYLEAVYQYLVAKIVLVGNFQNIDSIKDIVFSYEQVWHWIVESRGKPSHISLLFVISYHILFLLYMSCWRINICAAIAELWALHVLFQISAMEKVPYSWEPSHAS